jgi:formylglycine-generating enzyme required for sulfatase activity
MHDRFRIRAVMREMTFPGNNSMVLIRKAVRVIKSEFLISRYPVTVGDFRELVDGKVACPEEKDHVVQSTWMEAVKYCNLLSLKEGLPASYNEQTGLLINENRRRVRRISQVKGFRLPTAEEWEYAAKGWIPEKMNSRWETIQEKAYWGASSNGCAEAGNLQPNTIGLQGMIGDVHEWYSDTDRSEGFCNKKCGWSYYYRNYDVMAYCVEKRVCGESEVAGFRVALSFPLGTQRRHH